MVILSSFQLLRILKKKTLTNTVSMYHEYDQVPPARERERENGKVGEEGDEDGVTAKDDEENGGKENGWCK